jgi:hypothetical protein
MQPFAPFFLHFKIVFTTPESHEVARLTMGHNEIESPLLVPRSPNFNHGRRWLQGLLPQLHEFYFTTAEKKLKSFFPKVYFWRFLKIGAV